MVINREFYVDKLLKTSGNGLNIKSEIKLFTNLFLETEIRLSVIMMVLLSFSL